MNDYEKAELFLRRELEGNEAHLGKDHKDTKISVFRQLARW